jgi:hypothetical protein
MVFIKGHPPYFIRHSQETKQKLRLAKLGTKNPMFGAVPWNKGNHEYFAGRKNPFFGKTHSPEALAKMRAAKLGKPSSRKGKKYPALSAARKGSGNPAWKGGLTPLRTKIWHSKEYQTWRKAVFERDNYTCQICGRRGGILNADHIKRFAEYPELTNGRTLCLSCHRKTPTWGQRKSTPSQNYNPPQG